MRLLFPILTILLISLSACGPNRPPTPVERQMPAPRHAAPPPPVKMVPLDPVLNARARQEITAALKVSDPIIRSHALEAAQQTLKESAKATYLAGLSDKSDLIRFASIMVIGHLRIREASEELGRMVNDSNPRVSIAARFALHRLGDTRFSKDLEKTATSPIWGIRADTAMVLGMLNEPTASRILARMVKDSEHMVRIQAAEALWKLGFEDGLKMLIAYAQSSHPDDQMVALMALPARRDRRVIQHIRALLTADYLEVRLVAARAMGELDSDGGYSVVAEGIESNDPRHRALAALALGAIGRSDTQSTLEQLLKDSDADVRLCAAKAILLLKPPGQVRSESQPTSLAPPSRDVYPPNSGVSGGLVG